MKLELKIEIEKGCRKLHNGECLPILYPKDKRYYCPYRRPNGKGNHFNLDQAIARIIEQRNEKLNGTYRSPRIEKEKRFTSFIKSYIGYDRLINEEKNIIHLHRRHFYKEHIKNKEFTKIYTKEYLCQFEEIIVMGVGGEFEIDEYGNCIPSEINVLIDNNQIEKLLLIGLKGNILFSDTEITKEIKYITWINRGIKEKQFIRTWVDETTPLLIPYSEKKTLILIVKDGGEETTSLKYFKLIWHKRPNPNTTIDFFASRHKTQIIREKELGQSIEFLCKWTKASGPLFYYRIRKKPLNLSSSLILRDDKRC